MGGDGAWTGDSVGARRDGGLGIFLDERIECEKAEEFTRPPAPISARAEPSQKALPSRQRQQQQH
jgi:hypothetical protein